MGPRVESPSVSSGCPAWLCSSSPSDAATAAEEKTHEAWLAAARAHEQAGAYAKAIADYDAAAKLGPGDADLLRRRGIARFLLGDAKGSVADFDRQLAIDPDYAPYDWMRGISLYYAGEFEKGRAQFESHQKVNANDVENAAWHFLCVARIDGVEKARAALIPIQGDARVPMKEVQALFAGKATREDVLKAANGRPRGGPAQPALLRPPLSRALRRGPRGGGGLAPAHPARRGGIRHAALHGPGRARASPPTPEEVGYGGIGTAKMVEIGLFSPI